MAEIRPLIHLRGTFADCEVLDEIPPPKKTRLPASGKLTVFIKPATPDTLEGTDQDPIAKYRGKTLTVPAYMIYQYEPENPRILTSKSSGRKLGKIGALAGGDSLRAELDEIVVHDDPSLSTRRPEMYVGPTSDPDKRGSGADHGGTGDKAGAESGEGTGDKAGQEG